MIRKKLSVILIVFTIVLISPLQLKEINATDENPGPFFYVSVLAPATCPGRNQWSNLYVDLLPEIGIGIETFDQTGWSQIVPRTWGYPGPFPIPNYTLGGYDILQVGWQWDLDYDPTEIYHSVFITPNGDNFYQYNSTIMDSILSNYTTTLDRDERLSLAEDMQQVFYEDQPSLTILYSGSVYAHDADLTGWNSSLWDFDYQSMENWTIPGQTEFFYASSYSYEDFHIYKSFSEVDAQWLHQIYNGLIERSASDVFNYNYAPCVATSWNTTDGLNYTVELNPDAVWADNTPLNASDVEFSFKLLITPEFGHPQYEYWSQYLRNNSVTLIDEDTVHISFNKTNFIQERILGLKLIPKHIWKDIPYPDMEEQAATWAITDPSKIIGAGPYKLHSYDNLNEAIHLKRNDYYDNWTGITPYFEDIYFKFYPNQIEAYDALDIGSVDMVDARFSIYTLDDVPESATYTLSKGLGMHEFALNNLHPYFGTGEACPISGPDSAKHIRKAMSHIIPRDQIINDILNGMAFQGVTPYPIAAIGFDDTLEPYEYNRTKALEHMQAAGFNVDPTYLSPTISVGFRLEMIISILALIGGSLIIIQRSVLAKKHKMKE